MKIWKFYIETYGCKVNQYESQALREAWQRLGGIETDRPENADRILVNSCAITARAERSARNAVFRLKNRAPDAEVILSGCAAQFYGDFTPRKNAHWRMPDMCIPQAEKASLLSGPAAGPCALDYAVTSYGRSRPVVKVQDGCSQNCAYCIVPQTRGRPKGRPQKDILAECRTLARRGHGEIVLSGVNLRQYPGGFWKLLASIDKALAAEYRGRLRLRVSSIDPAMLGPEGLETLAACQLVCPHLHISLQHASDAVLAGMGRRHYNMAMLMDSLSGLSAIWPIFGLGADILVGFPGETETDMDILLRFIREMPLSYAHVFPYSRRQGTRALNFPGQIPRAEKEDRARRAREAAAAKTKIFLAKQLGLAQMAVAPEILRDGRAQGVNEFYTTCVFEGQPALGLVLAAPLSAAENRLNCQLL